MQTILNVTINPSVRNWEEQYSEKFLKIMLDNGAKVIHVTPILDVSRLSGIGGSYTKSLSYVIEEPETEEYKKIKEEQFKELQDKLDYLRGHNRY